MTERGHTLLVVAGLNDNAQGVSIHKSMARPFIERGFHVNVHSVGWADKNVTFEDKLDELTTRIELEMARPGTDYLSLMGYSAGGTMAVAAYMENPDVAGVVAISSPLNLLKEKWYTPIESFQKKTPLFVEANHWVNRNAPSLSASMRRRIMTLVAESGDDLYPPSCQLEGANNTVVPIKTLSHEESVVELAKEYDLIDVFLREGERAA